MRRLFPLLAIMVFGACDVKRENEEAEAQAEAKTKTNAIREAAAKATPKPKPGDWMKDHKGSLDRKPSDKR